MKLPSVPEIKSFFPEFRAPVVGLGDIRSPVSTIDLLHIFES